MSIVLIVKQMCMIDAIFLLGSRLCASMRVYVRVRMRFKRGSCHTCFLFPIIIYVVIEMPQSPGILYKIYAASNDYLLK